MIDEKKLVEDLKDWKNDEASKAIYGEEVLRLILDDCIIEVNNQPKIGEWIPCSDPPRHSNEVLIFNGKSYSVGYYDGKTWVNAIHPVEWQEINHELQQSD